jgi:hypothetical protein
MKKKYFYLFFIYLFSIFAFPLFAMEEGDSDSSFSDLNVSENFKEFYKQYFDKIFAYDQLQEIVKRFSFVFWYLKERNIGNILNFENNTYVDFQEKNLKEEEINQIKIFFKDTVSLISKNNIFNEYLKKSDKEDSRKDFLSDCFKRALKNLSLPEEFFEGRSEVTEDLTFLVKNVSYKPDYIQQHVASDVHSSPEYFGLEYEPMDFSTCNFEKDSLEQVYTKIKENMKEKKVSFFCGDLADRDSLGFLDEQVNQKNFIERENFFLYNFFKDYYHTVHAAWQFYCLCHEQPDKIKRWQVFGNHETSEMYKRGDYKSCYEYFSGLISRIRKLILPTEIYFLQSNRTIVLRHGFFTQKMIEENHVGKKVNENFKYIYLTKEPVQVYDQFSPFIKDYSPMNPVYWSDHHDTNNPLDLSVLVEGKSDGEKINIPMKGSLKNGYRGYYNPYSWAKGVEFGKQTSIENFELINKDYFLSADEFTRIRSKHWALFCGHSHNEYSLAFSAVKKNQAISFHPYYVRDEKFLFHFCMCSHHNLYVQWFDKAFKKIKETEVSLIGIDWKRTQPVHALETYWGAQWIKKKMQESKEILTDNSVIKSFFETKLGLVKIDNQLKKLLKNSFKEINILLNTQETQTEQPEKNEKEMQADFIREKLSLVEKTVVFYADLKKVEAATQIEINNKEEAVQTDKTMNLKLLESKLRFVIRGSFDRIKQHSKKTHDIDFLRTIGAGFLGAAGLSLVRQVKSQGIKNFSRSIYDSWQQKGKFRLVLKRKDIFIGGGGAAIGYALYSKFPLFFNRKKGNKDNNFQMKEN